MMCFFLRACGGSPIAFQDVLVSGGLLQTHGSKENPNCWLRVSNVGSKLLVPGFQEVVRAVELADRSVVGRFHAVIQRENILQTVSSEYLYSNKL